MQQTDLMDTCGSFWTASGFLYHYGNKKAYDQPEYCEAFKVFSVKGVCLLTTRQIIDHVGLFDDDYWCYFEETDFCHRVLLAGKDCWYSPSAEILHANGGTSSLQRQTIVQFHSFKNRLNSYLKNLELQSLLRILPIYFLINLAWAVKLIATGKFRIALVPFKAVLWNLANIRNTLVKRKHIQQNLRRIADRDLFYDVTLNPPLRYYLTFERGGSSFSDIQRRKP
jgi:GT2 family glycosyltransferase